VASVVAYSYDIISSASYNPKSHNLKGQRVKRVLIKFGVLLATIIFLIAVVKFYHLDRYLSLNGFNVYREQLMCFETEHPYAFISGYVIVYILLITLCIPGTILFDLIAGFIFGIYFGLILVIVSYGVGAFCNFLLVRYFFKEFFVNRFSRFKLLIHGSGKHGLLLNLIGLRFIAVIPFWVLNIVAAIINVRVKTFLISTLIGIIPSSLIYVVIGDGVREAFASKLELSPEILVNPKIWLPLVCMALLLLIPNFLRYHKHHKIRGRKLKDSRIGHVADE